MCLVRLALFLALACTALAEGDWEVLRFEGRDYLPLENVAKFYEFPTLVPLVSQILPANPAEPATKKFRLENGRSQMEVTLNSRAIVLNGVTQWISFPVAEINDRLVISRLDLSKTIEPMLRPEMIKDLRAVQTVVLDPGHGGHDKGATSIFGNEKDFALDVCTRARPLLESKGLKVVLTRTSDIFIPLEARPRVANALPESIFVSVHFNSAPANSLAGGFEIFSLTPRGGPSMDETFLTTRDLRSEPGNDSDAASSALSASIYHAMLGNLPLTDRGIKHQRFAVIRLARVPAVLIEGGFVSNAGDVRLLASPAWRQRFAEAIVTGIENYKALAEHHIPPKLLGDYRRSLPGLPPAPAVVTAPGTGAGEN